MKPVNFLILPLKWLGRLLLLLLLLLIGPLVVLGFGDLDLDTHWSDASMRSSQQAPRPRDHKGAVVQVYGARAYNWRGAFAIHTWISTKRKGADHYSTYQVLGWNLYRGNSVISVTHRGIPDFLWYNARPDLLVDHRGENAESMIDAIEMAVADYPYPYRYQVWPGPNSNTFTAHVARRVPQLNLDLPPTAIGKDYLPDGAFFDSTPSGTGWQVSLRGLLGISLAPVEGFEFNLLGLGFGMDFDDVALRLPGFGRVALISGQ
ncbi:MAG: DUF3750 domain-containing protein [Gammaproteobacteria bacterium]|nr:DUF3750 domain-containing protein [Gammaproteobacteria bacterium]